MDYLGVELKILQADVLSYSSDLLALKYAQWSYGVDEDAVRITGIDVATLPVPGDSLLIRNPLHLTPHNLLFLGVEPISTFSYPSIRDLSRRTLSAARSISPAVREISMTLHGTGFGLDETEAFESEIAGIVEALEAGDYPESLVAVSVIELDEARANRMRSALIALLDSAIAERRATKPDTSGETRRIDSVGYDSAARSHAFVAIPFTKPFEDVFYYGIAPPVRAAGLLCERIDQFSFTGDIIARMRERIASSAVMVADLSEANPNVYLEVGYAWGAENTMHIDMQS